MNRIMHQVGRKPGPNQRPPADAGTAVCPHIGGQLPGAAEAEYWVRRYMRRALLPIVIAVGVVCTSCRTPLTSASAEYFDIAEALFRHLAQPAQVNDPDSHGVNLAHKVYFLQLDSRDADASFLSRLKDLTVPVEPLSASVCMNSYRYDRETGQRGAAFYIQNIRLLGRNKAEAEADMNPGGVLRGSGFTYRLARKAGKWVVVGEKLRWIS
jgi:hypothetical protein